MIALGRSRCSFHQKSLADTKPHRCTRPAEESAWQATRLVVCSNPTLKFPVNRRRMRRKGFIRMYDAAVRRRAAKSKHTSLVLRAISSAQTGRLPTPVYLFPREGMTLGVTRTGKTVFGPELPALISFQKSCSSGLLVRRYICWSERSSVAVRKLIWKFQCFSREVICRKNVRSSCVSQMDTGDDGPRASLSCPWAHRCPRKAIGCPGSRG